MGATIYGYIRLESQMNKKSAYRDPKNGNIKRKPLKSKPRISPEFDRIIPVTDKEVWEALVKNQRRALDEYDGKIHSSGNVDDYLLFNIDMNEIRKDMRKHTKKTPHCCRNTYATTTVRAFRGVNYGSELIKAITDHSSVEFERYVHLSKEDDNEAKKRKVVRFWSGRAIIKNESRESGRISCRGQIKVSSTISSTSFDREYQNREILMLFRLERAYRGKRYNSLSVASPHGYRLSVRLLQGHHPLGS